MNLKYLLYRNFVWFGLAAAIGALVLATQMDWIGEPYVVGGIIAFAISTIFLVQQQRLEETRLFKELFTSFNERYDKLNDVLATIVTDTVLDNAKCKILIDYFNLCAEEYLFYREGYIRTEVWRAWCRGMKQYMEIPAITSLWHKEELTGSYYGLSLEMIDAGAQGYARVSTSVADNKAMPLR